MTFIQTQNKTPVVFSGTVISRLSTQRDLEMALRTYAGGAYLTVFVSYCTYVRTRLECYVIKRLLCSLDHC